MVAVIETRHHTPPYYFAGTRSFSTVLGSLRSAVRFVMN
jgi:nitric oxide reductase large subunit